MTTDLERHLARLTAALQTYTTAVLADDHDALGVAAMQARDAAGDFVSEAHDGHGGWRNLFAGLLEDEDWFDDAGDGVEAPGDEVVAVRARYDVTVTDRTALLEHASSIAEEDVERVADAFYELVHQAGSPVGALRDVPGLEVVAGVYVFSTSPQPLDLERMASTEAVDLLALEDGTDVLRSAADFPMFPDRASAEAFARRSARKSNLEG